MGERIIGHAALSLYVCFMWRGTVSAAVRRLKHGAAEHSRGTERDVTNGGSHRMALIFIRK